MNRKLPPEAFDYDSDVTPEGVKYMQDKANAAMKDGNWVEIDRKAFWQGFFDVITLKPLVQAIASLIGRKK